MSFDYDAWKGLMDATEGDAVAMAALLCACADSLSFVLTDAVARNVSTDDYLGMAVLHGRLLDLLDNLSVWWTLDNWSV